MSAPAKTLAADPVVESERDVELALAELSWMKSTEESINSELKAEITQLKERATNKLKTKRVTFADRTAKLKAALVTYAKGARDQLLAGLTKKTRDFSHGQLAYKMSRQSLELADAGKHAEHIEELKAGLIESLKRKRSAGVPSTDLYDVTVSLNRSRVVSLYGQGRLTAEQLEEVGLTVPPQTEEVTVKLHEYTAVSSSDAAA